MHLFYIRGFRKSLEAAMNPWAASLKQNFVLSDFTDFFNLAGFSADRRWLEWQYFRWQSSEPGDPLAWEHRRLQGRDDLNPGIEFSQLGIEMVRSSLIYEMSVLSALVTSAQIIITQHCRSFYIFLLIASSLISLNNLISSIHTVSSHSRQQQLFSAKRL